MLDHKEIEKEVLEFFFVFSRFEFALKEAGYLRARNRNCNSAEPDWGAFVRDYAIRYFPSNAVVSAVEYLTSQPPQKQEVRADENGTLQTGWEPFQIDQNASLLSNLVDVIKTVRNNLFHGGKYGESGWDDEARVSQLLTHSVSVIKDWLHLNNDLNVYYNDWA